MIFFVRHAGRTNVRTGAASRRIVCWRAGLPRLRRGLLIPRFTRLYLISLGSAHDTAYFDDTAPPAARSGSDGAGLHAPKRASPRRRISLRRRPMELHQTRYFLALARSLNFTRAAQQCNVTPLGFHLSSASTRTCPPPHGARCRPSGALQTARAGHGRPVRTRMTTPFPSDQETRHDPR